MQICKQRHLVATEGRTFPSNSGAKPHTAKMWTEGAPPFCPCKGFIFGRSRIAKAEGTDQRAVFFLCRHLEEIVRTTCDWAQKTEGDYQHNQCCPKCGGDVVDPDDSMVPMDPAATVHDLQTLLAEMNGTAPPPPLQRPTPHVVVFTETVTYRTVVDAFTPEEARSKVTDNPNGHTWNRASTFDDTTVDSTVDVVDAFEQKPEDVAPKPAPKKAAAGAAEPAPAARQPNGSATTAAKALAGLVKPATTRRR